jgi:peptide chain release factor 1
VDVVEESPTEKGGFDKVVFEVHGHGAYSQLKFEGGVHRVQRVPKTEAQGRIHTSAATVAVMPEADPVEVELKPEDIEIKTSTSQGPGGQSVNTTYSAIRITHKPTGMQVSIQDEKSQLQNKEKALRVLRARLYEIKLAEQQAKIGAQRRGMVGTGSRSEKIRTYNFKENRVTDHRIKLTLHRLDSVMNGDLDELVAALVNAERAALLDGHV